MGYSTTHFKSINPYTQEDVYEVKMHDTQETTEILQNAQEAFCNEWQDTTYEQRAKLLNAVAKQMKDNLDYYALPMTEEMGKPINEARGEVNKAALAAEHYAEFGEDYLKTEYLESDATESYVQYLPLGVTLGILPWNAPFWLAFRYLAPALMSGNTCIMKHDSHTPLCAIRIIEAFQKAGFPKNVVQNLVVGHSSLETIIRNPIVKGISLTGSSKAGTSVGAIAGSEIKPVVLELGGSDPAIILKDTQDLEKAADIITLSRYINAGQSCIAAKRIIVEEPIYEKFIELLKQRFEKLKLGDPKDETTTIGPIARKELVDQMHEQVDKSVAAGARLILGGQRYEGKGFFFPLTILADVEPGMVVSCQETFGPIAAIIKVKDEKEAIKVANDTEYGLGGSIWTGDTQKGKELAKKIVTGQVSINGIVKSDPRLPSGGVKKSGIGKELGPHGIKMFVNTQQVWVGPAKG
ncbi:succinate-semialdehyde dehydrogenase [Malaciobacter marinus]|uniref:Succinate-semialdehyde dehydrogenase n=1 Tax=Malaciobacter marinus TaxID=505249 RepID=A0A347TLC0_9BACT|nr:MULTISPECIES: NAD-dependent succinate-semialdehyde dehydrogenase [Malaciobacter]AXX87398.1 succinate-semialdehyde dehydrogenase [Malaciobacter marinus]PHO16259.1 succinate-semialdehyde dehydrogenase [Malaciobacter marinus]RYA23957.1 NAD-dependent succinate-semialdehyde dehydrogenase [Malaciobacter halophilus]